MIKKDVLLRSEIRTIYSSERQQRMRLYLQLTEKYQQCSQQNKLYPQPERTDRMQQCQKIYDEYANTLQSRYQGDNKQRLDMQVKNSPLFRSKPRPGRDTLFYRTFGVGWDEVFK